MCLNGGPLAISTLPPASNPVFLHLTLHAPPPVTISLIRNAWFQETADILTPENITSVFMARRYFIAESGL